MCFLACGIDALGWSCQLSTYGEDHGAIDLNNGSFGPVRPPADSPSAPHDACIVGDIQFVDACCPLGPRENEVPWNGEAQKTQLRTGGFGYAGSCHSVLDEL